MVVARPPTLTGAYRWTSPTYSRSRRSETRFQAIREICSEIGTMPPIPASGVVFSACAGRRCEDSLVPFRSHPVAPLSIVPVEWRNHSMMRDHSMTILHYQ
eukprot:6089291-Pyramimonas_sp.AAC.1